MQNHNYQFNGQNNLEMDWTTAFKLADASPSLFIDLRHPQPGQPEIPDAYACVTANELNGQLDKLNQYRYLFVFCYHGISSRPVAQSLRQNYNHLNSFSISGGHETLVNTRK